MTNGSLAIVNARMITMNSALPEAEAALVDAGRIVQVGTTREILNDATGVPVFDCGGRAVVPGFIDGHAHLEMTCLHLTRWLPLHVPPYKSLEEMASALKERATQTPPGEWIVARTSMGLANKVAEGRLFTRQELDAVTTDHPVAVLSSLHVAMLNSKGLQKLGLWEKTAEPPRGVTVHRDASGVPTGIAVEIWPMLPAFPKETVKEALREKAEEWFIANGVTTIHNLPYSADDVAAIQELQESGELPLRIRFFYHIPHQMQLHELLATGLKPGFGNDMLRYGGIKIFIDGIGNDGLGNPTWDVKWTEEELADFVTRAHIDGQQLWMHALHIDSLRLGMDVVEHALRHHPVPHRHRIEHSADYVREPTDMQRLRDLGIRVVTTPAFLHAGGKARRRFPSWRSLIDRGFEVIGSSDTTGSIPDGIAPLFNIGCALKHVPDPAEQISVDDALRMFTIWAASGAFEEDDKGSIEVGKFGDFAVLESDLRDVEPEMFFEMKVDATILGGDVVYER